MRTPWSTVRPSHKSSWSRRPSHKTRAAEDKVIRCRAGVARLAPILVTEAKAEERRERAFRIDGAIPSALRAVAPEWKVMENPFSRALFALSALPARTREQAVPIANQAFLKDRYHGVRHRRTWRGRLARSPADSSGRRGMRRPESLFLQTVRSSTRTTTAQSIRRRSTSNHGRPKTARVVPGRRAPASVSTTAATATAGRADGAALRAAPVLTYRQKGWRPVVARSSISPGRAGSDGLSAEAPGPPLRPSGNRRQAYSIAAVRVRPLSTNLCILRAQIATSHVDPRTGAAPMEINLNPANALASPTSPPLQRTAARPPSTRYATFMAKPLAGDPGSRCIPP